MNTKVALSFFVFFGLFSENSNAASLKSLTPVFKMAVKSLKYVYEGTIKSEGEKPAVVSPANEVKKPDKSQGANHKVMEMKKKTHKNN